jgi:hypothetical protein
VWSSRKATVIVSRTPRFHVSILHLQRAGDHLVERKLGFSRIKEPFLYLGHLADEMMQFIESSKLTNDDKAVRFVGF